MGCVQSGASVAPTPSSNRKLDGVGPNHSNGGGIRVNTQRHLLGKHSGDDNNESSSLDNETALGLPPMVLSPSSNNHSNNKTTKKKKMGHRRARSGIANAMMHTLTMQGSGVFKTAGLAVLATTGGGGGGGGGGTGNNNSNKSLMLPQQQQQQQQQPLLQPPGATNRQAKSLWKKWQKSTRRTSVFMFLDKVKQRTSTPSDARMLCQNCEDESVAFTCDDCNPNSVTYLCAECNTGLHKPKRQQSHVRHPFTAPMVSRQQPSTIASPSISSVPGLGDRPLSRMSTISADGTATFEPVVREVAKCGGAANALSIAKRNTMVGDVYALACDQWTPTTALRAAASDGLFRGRVVQVSCGLRHSAAVTETGALYVWGENDDWQLGLGAESKQARAEPTLVPLPAVLMVACGYRHTVCFTQDLGHVYTWGNGLMGKLGTGFDRDEPSPVRVRLPHDDLRPVHVACAQYNTGVVVVNPDRSDERRQHHEVYMWGAGESGVIGDGHTEPRLVPTECTHDEWNSEHQPVALAIGDRHACARCACGQVYTWGNNEFGQLGYELSDTNTNSVPQCVRALSDKSVRARQIACGERHTTIIDYDDALWSWGSGETHQIGVLDNVDQHTPVRVTLPSASTNNNNNNDDDGGNDGGQHGNAMFQVCAGQNITAVVTESGAVYAWGWGVESPTPKLMTDLEAEFVQYVGVGANETIVALTGTTQDIYYWNFDGDEDVSTIPSQQPPQDHQFPSLYSHLRGQWLRETSCGAAHQTVVTRGGRLLAWGENDEGQLGIGNTVSFPVPTKVMLPSTHMRVATVACGVDHTVAATVYGEVLTWGNGMMGKLGHGSENTETSPRLVLGLSAVRRVAAGAYNSAAINNDGQLYAWGTNNNGQLGVDQSTVVRLVPMYINTIPEPVASVKFGSQHTVAICGHDAAVYTWGCNEYGQLGRFVDDNTNDNNSSTDDDGGGGGSDGGGGGGGGEFSAPGPVGLTNVVKVDAGDMVTFAITDVGHLFGWGSSETKQLCQLVDDDVFVPTRIHASDGNEEDGNEDDNEPRFISVSAGPLDVVACDESNRIWRWGWTLGERPQLLMNKDGIPMQATQISCGTSVLLFST